MLSVPVLGWATDGLAFARALEGRLLVDIAAARRPDVIDAHFEYPDGVGAWLAGRRLGIPVAVTLRGKIVSLSRKTLRRMQIARMLRGVSARIAVSRSLAGWARRVGGSDLAIQVIPNGVDGAVFHPLDRTHARQSLRWPVGRRFILCVGHQQRVKGFDRVLAVAREVRAAVPDARFVLVGSTRGEASFRRALQRLLIDCNRDSDPSDPLAQMLPPVPGHLLSLMYNAADLLVNASRSEGWCNAVSEALASGTPVIATDVGGNSEQIFGTHLGTLVPDGDAPALTGTLLYGLRKPWDRQCIAAAGAARSWGDTAREAYRVLCYAALGGADPLSQAAGAPS
jgi:glycosyltransferase involved in cell wall biosynthesis